MSKKISQLDAATDEEVKNDSYVWAVADPTNGLAKKATGTQLKQTLQTQRIVYTALGTENVTLTLAQLEGMDILMIFRGVGPVYPAFDSGDVQSEEYAWDGTDITFGASLNLNERLIILYKNF